MGSVQNTREFQACSSSWQHGSASQLGTDFDSQVSAGTIEGTKTPVAGFQDSIRTHARRIRVKSGFELASPCMHPVCSESRGAKSEQHSAVSGLNRQCMAQDSVLQDILAPDAADDSEVPKGQEPCTALDRRCCRIYCLSRPARPNNCRATGNSAG